VIDRSTAYPVFGWRAGRLAVRLARRGEVDVVHAIGASGLGYAMARRRHEPTAPFVFNPQGLEEFGATHPGFATVKRLAYTPLQTAVRTCARAADIVIATDRALVPTVLRHLPVDPGIVRVVPNAVDLEAIDASAQPGAAAALRARLGIEDDEVLLLSVGRLEENKGFHVLARALGQLLERESRVALSAQEVTPGFSPAPSVRPAFDAATAPRWRWALIGDGPFRDRILEAAQSAGLGSRMIAAGRVADAELAAWYQAATIFVHPTLYEGSSLVTLEAMAHARPVIASRAGGLPDKVVQDVTGWLVEPGDAGALADAIDLALRQTDRLEKMGRAGRAVVEREFAWPPITDRLIEIYRALTDVG
jgi:glycosyltransferase involved in cell wall biosynthesis